MAGNRPRSREKNVTGGSKGVKRRGSGLGTGPVGSGNGPMGTGGAFDGGGDDGGSVTRASGGGKSPLLIIIVLVVSLLGGGGGLTALLPMLLGGGSSDSGDIGSAIVGELLGGGSNSGSSTSTSTGTSDSLGSLLGGLGAMINTGTTSTGWELEDNTGRLNTAVDSEARAKRTQILGKGKDEVTIMVYMCGTDLESRSGMGTSDL